MSAYQSFFTRIFAGDVGIDLYSRAVSDLYQDLFGADIYVGKGIYAVDAFEMERPAGLTRMGLSGRVAAGVDPCAALQLHIAQS